MKSNKQYTMDEQIFLELAREIQKNQSTVVGKIQTALKKQLTNEVKFEFVDNQIIYFIDEPTTEPKEFKPIQGVKPKMFNEEEQEQIKKLFYIDKMSKNKIAKIMKCNEKTIRNYLKDTNEPI